MNESLKYTLKHERKEGMVAYISSHPEEFDDLVQLALSQNQPYSWRAAWLLSNYIDENDRRMIPYISRIIDILSSLPDGQQRDLINVLRKMELDEDHEGIVLDICINIWSKVTKIPSARYNAFRLALPIFQKYPELKQEFELMTQKDYLDSLSPGIRRSIQKIIEKHNR